MYYRWKLYSLLQVRLHLLYIPSNIHKYMDTYKYSRICIRLSYVSSHHSSYLVISIFGSHWILYSLILYHGLLYLSIPLHPRSVPSLRRVTLSWIGVWSRITCLHRARCGSPRQQRSQRQCRKASSHQSMCTAHTCAFWVGNNYSSAKCYIYLSISFPLFLYIYIYIYISVHLSFSNYLSLSCEHTYA